MITNCEDLNTPINEYLSDLSIRTGACLTRSGVQTIGELISLTEEEITQTRNFGKKSLVEIETRLAEKELSLAYFKNENIDESTKEILLQKRKEFLDRREKNEKEKENKCQLEKINKENKEKLKIELDDLKERYAKEVNELQEKRIKDKYENKENFDISFYPLVMLLAEKKITIAKLCQETKLNAESVHRAIKGLNLLMTETLAKIAAYLRVPMSSIVKFNGYDMKSEFAARYGINEDFEVPEVILGEPTYQPLKDFLKFSDEYKTLSNIFDKIISKKDGRKENGKKNQSLVNTKKREYKGMPGPTRVKIMHDESVNIKTIYKICKLLQCNVDFVFGWK